MKDDSKDHVIYVGPTIPGGSLRKYDTYIGGIPKHLSPLIAKCGAIGALFINVKDLPGHETELRNSASSLSQLSLAVARWTNSLVNRSR